MTARHSALTLAVLCACASLGAAYATTGAPRSVGAGNDLLLLLRFMAGTKLAMALAAALLVDWRLRYPASANVTCGYLLSVAIVAIAPGLIWFQTQIVLASVLFHAGVLLMLVTGLRDQRRCGRSRIPIRLNASVQ
jgi:hypothetical protein